MKLKYKLIQLSFKDIESIWEFTAHNWSTSQADKYYRKIFDGINWICKNAMIGKGIGEIKENHWSFLVGSHMIIYKQEYNLILIDRVLHQRMDIDDDLNE